MGRSTSGKNQRKISPPEHAVPAVTTDPTRYSNGTPLGTEEITRDQVAKLASMCTFGQPVLIALTHSLHPSVALDTSTQLSTTTLMEATIRPPSAKEATNTYVVEALTGHRPGPDGIPLFRFRWYGYAADDDTWESANQV